MIHEIDVRNLHNEVRSKYLELIGSNRPDISLRYTPVAMYSTFAFFIKAL